MLSATQIQQETEFQQDFINGFFLDAQFIDAALEDGNTRAVAHLSLPFGEDLPVMKIEHSLESLARKGGNLNTLLYVVVWRLVSKGKIAYRFLIK